MKKKALELELNDDYNWKLTGFKRIYSWMFIVTSSDQRYFFFSSLIGSSGKVAGRHESGQNKSMLDQIKNILTDCGSPIK